MLTEFPDNLIVTDNHTAQTFSNQYSIQRANWYGVSGVPDVYFNASTNVLGAGTCQGAANSYRQVIQGILGQNGGMSPVGVRGTYTINGSTATLEATFVLLDPVILSNVRAAFILAEDGLVYGGTTYNHITRVIQFETVTGLVNIGDEVTITKNIPITGWNVNNLHASVALENASGSKMIHQAAKLPNELDFSVSCPAQLASVPQGNGSVEFSASLWNLDATSDQFTLGVQAPAGWTAEFQIAGDPNWYTNHQVVLAADESRDIAVRVTTNSTVQIGTIEFSIASLSSGRDQVIDLRVFNGSYAILLVDDDANSAYEIPFEQALPQLGYLFDNWDSYYGHGGASPSLATLLGYDAVIWQTGYKTSDLVNAADKANLMAYLDAGGKLYLNSMDQLSTETGPNPFLTDYLGLSTWQNNTRADILNGVSGDPVTDGLSLPLTFPQSNANRVDTVEPVAGASVIFHNQLGHPNGLRYERNAFRTVFVPVIQDAIYDADQNNSKLLIGRILDWLIQSDPTGAGEIQPLVASGLTIQPNPFRPETGVRFALGTSTAGSVRLSVVDPAGRLVRTLVDGRLEAGDHQVTWDGADDAGRQAAAGVYFFRLQTAAGDASAKVVRVR